MDVVARRTAFVRLSWPPLPIADEVLALPRGPPSSSVPLPPPAPASPSSQLPPTCARVVAAGRTARPGLKLTVFALARPPSVLRAPPVSPPSVGQKRRSRCGKGGPRAPVRTATTTVVRPPVFTPRPFAFRRAIPTAVAGAIISAAGGRRPPRFVAPAGARRAPASLASRGKTPERVGLGLVGVA